VIVGRNYTLNAAVEGRVYILKDTESPRKIVAVVPDAKDKRVLPKGLVECGSLAEKSNESGFTGTMHE
jgi:hypothetical protein